MPDARGSECHLQALGLDSGNVMPPLPDDEARIAMPQPLVESFAMRLSQ